MAQHHDFDSQLCAIPAEPAEDLNHETEGSVKKGEGHGRRILVLRESKTMALVLCLDEYLAPTGEPRA